MPVEGISAERKEILDIFANYSPEQIRAKQRAIACHISFAVILVAMVIFGVLGMTKTGVFGKMGDVTAKVLTGLGGSFLALQLLMLASFAVYSNRERNPIGPGVYANSDRDRV